MSPGSFASPNEPTKRKKAPTSTSAPATASARMNTPSLIPSLQNIATKHELAERHRGHEPHHGEQQGGFKYDMRCGADARDHDECNRVDHQRVQRQHAVRDVWPLRNAVEIHERR